MFACGVPGTTAEKALSIAVECTVFRIRTPGGEVFTLPLSEIRGLHALSAELMQEMEREAAARQGTDDADDQPFGLAAFRSIANTTQTPTPATSPPGAAPQTPPVPSTPPALP
jgi:hypothetical protein